MASDIVKSSRLNELDANQSVRLAIGSCGMNYSSSSHYEIAYLHSANSPIKQRAQRAPQDYINLTCVFRSLTNGPDGPLLRVPDQHGSLHWTLFLISCKTGAPYVAESAGRLWDWVSVRLSYWYCTQALAHTRKHTHICKTIYKRQWNRQVYMRIPFALVMHKLCICIHLFFTMLWKRFLSWSSGFWINTVSLHSALHLALALNLPLIVINATLGSDSKHYIRLVTAILIRSSFTL